MKTVCFSVVIVISLCAATLGAPTESTSLRAAHNSTVLSSICQTMAVSHGGQAPQSSIAPYTIQVSQTSASPGDTVEVKISSVNSEEFRGVYIQGRSGEVPVGQFIKLDPQVDAVKISDCVPGSKNAASYISRQPISELTLRYVIPDVPSVTFKASFVKTFSVFWMGVTSEEILIVKAVE